MLASAQARVNYTQKNQARAEQLVTTKALAIQDYDQRVNDHKDAQASVRGADADLTLARLNLGYTEVRAPIDGRIGRIEVTEGNLVPAGASAPVLTTLVSVDPVYASFEVDEQTVLDLLAQLPDRSDLTPVPIEMISVGGDKKPIKGELQFLDNIVNTESGTVRLRAVFTNADSRLIPGQYAKIKLGQPDAKTVLAISERAIGTDQDRRYVLVVGQDHKAQYREVTLGAMAGDLRIITSGLKDGDQIVVNGLQRVQPGSQVATKVVEMTAMSGQTKSSEETSVP